MATGRMNGVIQHLRRAVLPPGGAGLTDGQLLTDYVCRRDEAALAALVRRHGPMVWGVCRRVLSNYHDAEDAFQATFLVLVRRAASIASRELLANWLYGVAHQTASKARATAARRTVRERQVTGMPEPAAAEQDLWDDLRPLLDQELSRLPDGYRAVIVLCDLEGNTRSEAARVLGLPEGTVGSRLARARVMLAKRLTRRGVVVSGGALATVLSQNVASAGVPTTVVSSTIKVATLVAAGEAATGAVSVEVAALTEGVMNVMLVSKLKVVTALVVVAVLSGAAGLIYRTQAAEPPRAKGATDKAAEDKRPAAAKKDEKPRPDKERLQGTWKVVSIVDDGEKDEELGDWTVKGMTVKARTPRKNGAVTTGYYRLRLDETTNPKLIDLVEAVADDLFDTAKLDKRLEDADERIEGIYTLAGDTLKICISLKKGERPTAFESKRESNYILIVLAREKEGKRGDKGDKP